MSFCWHTLPNDPPGTKPYVTWGGELECPVCHPDLYEPYGKPVVTDFHSGEPCTPDGQWIPAIIHANGQWLKRKKVLVDPTRPLHTPVAEVRAQSPVHVDSYGESWVVIDGIETKVPSIKAARARLSRQDAVRTQIRADLDAAGIRFNPDGTDREEQVEITLDDGTKTTVGLMKPGDANYMQIETFPDAEGLLANAEIAQQKADAEAARQKAFSDLAQAQAEYIALPWWKRIFRKEPS